MRFTIRQLLLAQLLTCLLFGLLELQADPPALVLRAGRHTCAAIVYPKAGAVVLLHDHFPAYEAVQLYPELTAYSHE